MDIPIRVIITLFVALIVGVGLVSFSQTIIKDARKKVSEYGNQEVTEDRIIETSEITSSQLAGLAETCYYENTANELEEKDCFVVFGNVNANEGDIIDALNNLNESLIDIDISNAQNAVRVKYNPFDDIVMILG